jgi:hypothetical protein
MVTQSLVLPVFVTAESRPHTLVPATAAAVRTQDALPKTGSGGHFAATGGFFNHFHFHFHRHKKKLHLLDVEP